MFLLKSRFLVVVLVWAGSQYGFAKADCSALFAKYPVLQNMSDDFQEASFWAYQVAKEFKSSSVEPAHILFAALKDPSIPLAKTLSAQGISVPQLQAALAQMLDQMPKVTGTNVVESLSSKSLGTLKLLSDGGNRSLEDLVAHLAKGNDDLARVLKNSGMKAGELRGSSAALAESSARIPPKAITVEALKKLDQDLPQKVIGQEHAIRSMRSALTVGAANLADPVRPRGIFLFPGPPGVGKTSMFESFADTMGLPFHLEDMGNYQYKESLTDLIRPSAGLVGSDDMTRLEKFIVSNPQGGMILFDEIEKAYKDVFDVLLPALEKGYLVIGKKRYSVSNFYFGFTSNQDAKWFAANAGKLSRRELERHARELFVKAGFRPEFMTRIDDIIPFNNLTPEALRKIVSIHVENFNGLLKAEGLGSAKFSPGAVEELARLGYSPDTGARDLRKVFRDEVKVPIAERKLAGTLTPGKDIQVDFKNGKFIFE